MATLARESHPLSRSSEVAARVLSVEAAALSRMAEALPEDFDACVDLIAASTGRVIVSGVGKSGHVARKISATLASTGTPSHYIHPTEASHGDLGALTARDICILISNSGETSELGDMITHCRRFGIPLLGVSSNANSTLMRAADLKLTLPSEPEACLIGMAPTTSTTMTMALGDALAVALMEERGFRAEHFRAFHPGGKLGAQLVQVHQLMHPREEMPVVAVDAPMGDTLVEMTEKGFGVACVVENGKLVGVISDGDLRRNMADLLARTAGAVATRTPKTVPPHMLAADALRLIYETKVHAVVVVDDACQPVGLLRIHDCLRAGVA